MRDSEAREDLKKLAQGYLNFLDRENTKADRFFSQAVGGAEGCYLGWAMPSWPCWLKLGSSRIAASCDVVAGCALSQAVRCAEERGGRHGTDGCVRTPTAVYTWLCSCTTENLGCLHSQVDARGDRIDESLFCLAAPCRHGAGRCREPRSPLRRVWPLGAAGQRRRPPSRRHPAKVGRPGLRRLCASDCGCARAHRMERLHTCECGCDCVGSSARHVHSVVQATCASRRPPRARSLSSVQTCVQRICGLVSV